MKQEFEITTLVRDCISGKREAQKRLYQHFQKKMFGVCLRYAKDHTEAEDILQDGFIRVFNHLHQFKNKGSLEGWIKKIMINTALERFRKKEVLYISNEVEEYEEQFNYEDTIGEISSQDLMKLIRELTPQYRTVFSLFAIEGYTHQEISKMLKISVGTSKSNLSRARIILQEEVRKAFASVRKYKMAK